jgi:O-antigen/teichoic acid export membrane protein
MIKKLGSLLQSDFIKKSIKVLSLRFSGIGIQFIILLVLTNFFSEALVGQFNYINTVLILISSICLLGMNESFIQFSGKLEAINEEFKIRQLYFKKLFILIISYFGISFFYILFSKVNLFSFFNESNIYLFNKTFYAVFFLSLSLLNFQVIRGLRKLFISEFFRNIIRYGFILICVLIVLVFKLKANYILESFIISFFLIAFITTFYILNLTKKYRSKKQLEFSYKEIIITSAPMSLSFISLLLMQSFDIIMLEYYTTIEQVAYYSIGVKLTFIVGVMLLTINSVIAPDISKLWFQNEKEKLNNLLQKAIKLNFIITIPLILILLVFSKQILSLFGPNYYKSQYALIILLIGQIINSLSGSVGLYLNMTARQKILLYFLVFAAILNIVFNIILIPKYGIEGAAISTSFSLIFWNIAGVIYVYLKDKIWLFVNLKTFK